jgi:N-acetylglucosamine-6-phosphate deacetylase
LISALVVTHAFADQSSDHQVGLKRNTPSVWALTNAKVVCRCNQTLDNATVVIRDGRIASVHADNTVPPDARVIDLKGKTVYPGFIDGYSEVGLSSESLNSSAKYWNPNITPQLTVASQAGSFGSANSALRKQGIVARLVAPSKGIIRGQSAVLSTGTSDPNVAVLATDVAQHLELTVSQRSRTVYPGSPMGAVALARQTMYDAQWYQAAWNASDSDPTLPRPEINDALAALQPVIEGKQPIVVETSNQQFFLRAERFAGEFGLNLIVRGSGLEYRRLDEIAATGRPVILPLNFPKPPNVASAEIANGVTLQTLMHWDLAPENPARVDSAGISFAFSTDQLSSTSDFLKAVRTAVQRGLSKESALRALTETPAELFGVSQLLGSVEAGKLASLVITDGDLFDSKTKIVETWIDGNRFEHSQQPTTAVAGTYELRLPEKKDHPQTLFVKITEDSGLKLKGQISQAPFNAAQQDDNDQQPEDTDTDDDQPDVSEPKSAVIDVKKLAQSEYTVSGQFAGKDWGLDGIIRLSLLFVPQSGNEEVPAQVTGRVTWPDGSVVASAAQVVDEQATASADTPDADDSAVESADDQAVAESQAKDDQPEDDQAADDAKASRKRKASFAVNYPLGAFGRESIPVQEGLVAFRHATIWTSGPDGIIENGTLLIDSGVIVAVGKEVDIPANATIIDVKGTHITPGIIDCHSHMATDGGVNESTQAISCEVRIGDFIDADDIAIYRQLAGGVTTSNILHGSANPIGGQNQVIKLRWGMTGQQMKFAEAPPGVKFALGENVKQSNWGDNYTTRYPQTRMGVEQVFRDAFIAAREYAIRMDSWQDNRRGLPPRRDLELDALREIVEHKRWIHCHSYRQDEILALIRVLDEFGITIGTFQHILEGYKVAEAMAEHGAMGSAFSDWWAYKFEVYDAIPYAGAIMHEAGIVVSFNSDDAELARHLNQEAAKAVKYGGVSPAEAFKFVTLNPARQLRIDEYVGSLEKGKHADFVVWNGSPLSNLTRCEQTWIDGRRYFHRDEDNQLRTQVAGMRNTLIQKILSSGEKMQGDGEGQEDPTAMWPRYDEFCKASVAGAKANSDR